MRITYPLLTAVDDSGAALTPPVVTITSVTDKAGSAINSHGATVNLAGANVSVDYDAAAKGEAWVTLAISKVSSTVTGLNAAPSFYLAGDSGATLGTYAGLLATLGVLAAPTVSAAASATSFTLNFGTPVTAANLVGLTLKFPIQSLTCQLEFAAVTAATQGTDSSHVVVTVAAGALTATPTVGDTVIVF